MAGPVARFLAQALIIGGGVVIKAFVEAYQRVAANPEAARAAAEAARKSSGGARTLLKNQMQEREAMQVLNFEARPQSREELRQRYQRYFYANDPAKGGSLYLQSKIYRANEALERAMGLAPEPVVRCVLQIARVAPSSRHSAKTNPTQPPKPDGDKDKDKDASKNAKN